jgi:flavin-dependent dehydrogenase
MIDVAVVGAGLAGLRCARLLAGRGLRVVILDRKDSIGRAVQTTGIFVRKTWEDFPLPEEQLGPPIRDVVLYSPALKSMRLRARQDEFRIGRMAWIYLDLLDQCATLGVRWIPSARFETFESAELTFVRKGRRERIKARFLVGADGARSAVAAQLGLDRNRDLLAGLEDVVPSMSARPTLHCFLDPWIAPGYIGWVADDGREAHVGVAGRRRGWSPAAALSQFRARLPFPIGRALERRGGLIPVGGILRRIACHHGLLIGDAAGAVSPLTAGGLDGAMRLSALAADVIAAHLDGDRDAIAQYTGQRFRARFLARRWMRHAIDALSTPAIAELAFAMLRLPMIHPLAEHIFFSRGSFPDTRFVIGVRTEVPAPRL